MSNVAERGVEAKGERRVAQGRAPGELASLLRWGDLKGVELLRADFRNHAFLPHWHDAYMIAAAAQGSERLRHNRVEHVVGPGTLALLNPGEVHDGEAVDPKIGWNFRALYVAPEVMAEEAQERELRLSGELRFARTLLSEERDTGIYLDLHRAIEKSTSKLQRDSYFALALSHLFKMASFLPVRQPAVAAKSSLDRARDYLAAEWARPVSLKELSKIAGLSRYHLLRSFRSRFGLPPHAYQMQLRVLHAKEFLFAGMPARDAAQEAGFCDQAHLTHALRRSTGVTPGCMRIHIQQ
jgi:AraC-like DNA-binding protein